MALHPAEAVAAELEAIACRLPDSTKTRPNPEADARRNAYFESARKIRAAFTQQALPGNGEGSGDGKAAELLAERLFRFVAARSGSNRRWPDIHESDKNGWREDARLHLNAIRHLLTQPAVSEVPGDGKRDFEYELHEAECEHGSTLFLVDRLADLLRRVTAHPTKTHPGRPAVSFEHLNAEIMDEIKEALEDAARAPKLTREVPGNSGDKLSQIKAVVEKAQRDSRLGNGAELEDPLEEIGRILGQPPSPPVAEEATPELDEQLAEERVRYDGLREIVDDAIPVIDRLFEFFATSGLSEEGGGLALHEASKPLADIRARLAEATQQQPVVADEGEPK